MGGVVVFVGVVVAVTAGMHAYLYRRLVWDTTRSPRVRRVGLAAVVALGLLPVATLVLGRSLGRDAARWLAWPAYVWLGLMFYLLVVLLVLEAPRFAAGLALSKEATGPTVSRRVVLARSGAAIAGVAAVGLVGYGMTSALGTPRVTRLSVPLRRLDPGLDGLRIAVVADLHLGPMLGRRHTERMVRTINEAEPDVVAIVGDLVDGTVAELGGDAAPLADLVSRHGSFFVTGNHEYYSGADAWVAELERLGVRPLRNERVEIFGGPGGRPPDQHSEAGGAVLDLAGVDDLAGVEDGDGPDFDRALDGRDGSRPVVLLAHQPVQVHEAAARGVDLQLSGHTHGGQLYPFHHLIRLEQPVVAGLARFGDTQLYVTRGTGFWGPPVRVGAPPEIAIVELTTG